MHIHTHYASTLRDNTESLSFTRLELLSCPELHSILRLVLKAGNYMNAVSASLLCLFSLLQPDKAEPVPFLSGAQYTSHSGSGCVYLGTSL